MAGEFIQRDLEGILRKNLKNREILAVLGPRQSGKTTLLERLHSTLDNSEFITLENQKDLDLFENDIDSFIELHVKGNDYLFIDEVQYATEGGNRLKYIYDTQKIKMLISGSSAPGVSIHSLSRLVGRVFIFHLFPCSFREFLAFKEPKLAPLISSTSPQIAERILPLYKEFLVYGGYPRVVLSKDDSEKSLVLKNIYNTYLIKEIKEIMQIPTVFELERLAKGLALQIGGLVNYSELAETTGLPYRDIIRYIAVLENTFVCRRALPFFSNKRTELSKTPKVFFYDNGFRNTILDDFSIFDSRSDVGMLNENFIASELSKSGFELKYWRTKAKAEVDFIVKGIPVEVKSSLSNEKVTKSLASFIGKHKPQSAVVTSYSLKGMRRINETAVFYEPHYNIVNIVADSLK